MDHATVVASNHISDEIAHGVLNNTAEEPFFPMEPASGIPERASDRTGAAPIAAVAGAMFVGYLAGPSCTPVETR